MHARVSRLSSRLTGALSYSRGTGMAQGLFKVRLRKGQAFPAMSL